MSHFETHLDFFNLFRMKLSNLLWNIASSICIVISIHKKPAETEKQLLNVFHFLNSEKTEKNFDLHDPCLSLHMCLREFGTLFKFCFVV